MYSYTVSCVRTLMVNRDALREYFSGPTRQFRRGKVSYVPAGPIPSGDTFRTPLEAGLCIPAPKRMRGSIVIEKFSVSGSSRIERRCIVEKRLVAVEKIE